MLAGDPRHGFAAAAHEGEQHFDGMDGVPGQIEFMVLFERPRAPGHHAGDAVRLVGGDRAEAVLDELKNGTPAALASRAISRASS